MKRSAFISIATLGTVAISLLAVAPVIATTKVEVSNNGEGAKTNVKVNTNTGGNTVCVNGKCTTSGGSTGQSTVCINGKCTTSTDGNINIQSEDGNAKVDVNNNGDSNVNVTQKTTESVGTTVNVNTNTGNKKVQGTKVSPNPTVEQKKKEVIKKVEAKKEEIKKHYNEFNLFDFLKKFFGF